MLAKTKRLNFRRSLGVAATISIASGAALAAPHTVVAGETLYSLSRTVGSSVAVLITLNHLTSESLQAGQVVQLPNIGGPTIATAVPVVGVALRSVARRYTVQPHETLYGIAARFNLTPAVLQAANGLRSTVLKVGQELILPPAEASVADNAPPTLSAPRITSISVAKPGLPGAPPKLLVPNLVFWTANGAQAPAVGAALPSTTQMDLSGANLLSTQDVRVAGVGPAGVLTLHTVQAGENLFRISLRFNIPQDAIKAANNMDGIALVAGQTLRIPTIRPPVISPAGQLTADVRPVAERYLGVPYRYGGVTPSGLDCSGFTSVVLLELGVKVPRTAEAQYAAGAPVNRDGLRPGDLVFFDTLGNGVSHVGIYLADGTFIHAASLPPKVIESRLDELYYASRFVGARRFLPDPAVAPQSADLTQP